MTSLPNVDIAGSEAPEHKQASKQTKKQTKTANKDTMYFCTSVWQIFISQVLPNIKKKKNHLFVERFQLKGISRPRQCFRKS